MCWFHDVRGILARAADIGLLVSAVDHEGNAAFFEAHAKQSAVAVRERVIENGSRKTVMFDEQHSVPQRIGARQFGAGMFESQCDVHNDKRFIFHDEYCPTRE